MSSREVLIRFEVDDDGAVKKIHGINDAIENTGKSAQKSGNSIKMVGGAFAAVATAIGVAGIAAVKVGAEFEKLQVTLNGVVGSAETGEKAMSWIKSFARETPYQVDQITKSFIQLQNAGINPTAGAMEAIGNMVAQYGAGSAESMDSVVRALGQISAATVVTKEDLNQLTEQQIPVFRILKEEAGMTAEQVRKIGDEGMAASDFMAAFQSFAEKNAAGAMAAQMKTLNGSWSSFVSIAKEALEKVASGGMLEAITAGIVRMEEGLKSLVTSDLFPVIVSGFTNLAESAVWWVNLVMDGVEWLAENWRKVWGTLLEVTITAIDGFFGNLSGQIRMMANSLLILDELIGTNMAGAVLRLEAAANRLGGKALAGLKQAADDNAKSAARFEAGVDGATEASTHWTDVLGELNQEMDEAGGDGGTVEKTTEKIKDLADATERSDDAHRGLNQRLVESESAFWAAHAGAAATREVLADMSTYLRNGPGSTSAYANALRSEFQTLGAELGGILGSGLNDALVGVFNGDDVSDAWENMSEDFANMLAGMASESFSSSMSHFTSGAFQDAPGEVNAAHAGNALMGLAAGYAADQGDAQLAGAISGAMAGMQFGPWGAVIGAIAGYFMSPEGPEATSMSSFHAGTAGNRTGQSIWGSPVSGGLITGPGEGNAQQIRQQLESRIREERDIWRGYTEAIALTIGDLGIFDLIGDGFSMQHTGEIGSLDAFINQWLDVAIPNELQDAFSPAIVAGMGAMADGMGVNLDNFSGYLDDFMGRIKNLPLEDRRERMDAFIRMMIDGYTLMEGLTEEGLMSGIGLSDMDRYREAIEKINTEIGAAAIGFEDMDSLDRATQLEKIMDLVGRAREAEIAMLEQINQISEDITRSIAGQREKFELSGMSDTEQADYFYQQFLNLYRDIGNETDAATIGQMTGEAQSYLDALFSLMGEDGTIAGVSGYGAAGMDLEDLLRWLDNLEEQAQGSLEDARQEVILDASEMLEELRLLFEEFFGPLADYDPLNQGGADDEREDAGTEGGLGDQDTESVDEWEGALGQMSVTATNTAASIATFGETVSIAVASMANAINVLSTAGAVPPGGQGGVNG